MSRSVATQTGKYLYAVIPASLADSVGEVFGLDEAKVDVIVHGPLAAIVSETPHQKLRPERRNIAAHRDVLNHLLERGPMLPAAFGIVADSEAGVRDLLAEHEAEFKRELARIEGKVEMGVRVRRDVPNIFEYFVGVNSELKAFRDRLFGGGENPPADEKIALGQLFEQTLRSDRAELQGRVTKAVESVCDDVKALTPRDEYEVMNLACLVPAKKVEGFRKAVEKAAGGLGDEFKFDISGPWPAYNFVELRLGKE